MNYYRIRNEKGMLLSRVRSDHAQWVEPTQLPYAMTFPESSINNWLNVIRSVSSMKVEAVLIG